MGWLSGNTSWVGDLKDFGTTTLGPIMLLVVVVWRFLIADNARKDESTSLRAQIADLHEEREDLRDRIERLEVADRDCRRRLTFVLGLLADSGIAIPDDILP